MSLSAIRETEYGQNDEIAKYEERKARRLFHVCFAPPPPPKKINC